MESERTLARIAAKQHGVFSKAQALDAGMSSKMVRVRLEKGLWRPVHRGIYRLESSQKSWLQSLMAACLGGKMTVASHRSAARLHKLAGINSAVIEVTAGTGNGTQRGGVRSHESRRMDPADITVVNAIPVTTIPRTLIDLAAIVPNRILEEALDDALRRGRVSLKSLTTKLAVGARGVPGTSKLSSAVQLRNGMIGVPKSVLETRLLGYLVRAGIAPPASQFPILVGPGSQVSVDFAYPDLALAIEVQSLRHHLNRRKWEEDLARHNRITAAGWRLFHATWAEIAGGAQTLIAEIRSAQLLTDAKAL